MTWLLKLKLWALGILAAIVAVASAWLLGRHKGAATQKAAQTASDAQAAVRAAQDTIKAHEVRHEVEAEFQKLPDAPPQRLGTADPATAAGRLRTDGWLRDENGREG